MGTLERCIYIYLYTYPYFKHIEEGLPKKNYHIHRATHRKLGESQFDWLQVGVLSNKQHAAMPTLRKETLTDGKSHLLQLQNVIEQEWVG